MINDAGGESESWLLWLVNRVFRCSHRRHGRPITPRGGGQSYAVCLDCGTRFAYDLKVMQVETSVPGSSPDRQTSERVKKTVLDLSGAESVPSASAHRETMRTDSRWRSRDVGTAVVLCLGAMSLAGAFLYSPHRRAQPKRITTPPHPRRSLAADSVKSSPSLPVQESTTEGSPAPQSDILATPTVSTEPEFVTRKKTIESDSMSTPEIPPSNRVLRLDGKGSLIVLGRKAVGALELAQHPGRLRKLIRRGALFTVARGTPIKVIQGNRLGNKVVLKVRLMAGSMVGQEGWAQTWQISP
jgi:hypothetical protein